MQISSSRQLQNRQPNPSFPMRRSSNPTSPVRTVTREGMSQQWLKDFAKFSEKELRGTLEKNEKVLKNRSLLSSLPDKGAKLRATNAKISSLLAERSSHSSTAIRPPSDLSSLMTELRLESGKKTPDQELSPNSGGDFKLTKGSLKDPPSSGKVRLISLAESLEIQKEHRRRIEEENLRIARGKVLESTVTQNNVRASPNFENLSYRMSNMHLDQEVDDGMDDDDDDDDEVQFVYPEPEDEGYQGYDDY